MAVIASKAPVVVVEPDVLPHVRAKGVDAVLQRLLAATTRVFPTLRELRVRLSPDPEIRDYTFIVFEVRVSRTDVPDYIEALERWDAERVAVDPPPHREPFVLNLRREAE
ncbi:MAG: hypothetical protein K2W96_25950 [Gemmataceae bacterium]|nr:hypothetical protein [Gemmataceae bacterium]